MDQDCEEPICIGSSNGIKPKHKFDNLQNLLKKSSPTLSSQTPNFSPASCPLNKETLGNYTWSFLHTMSVYYPDHPTLQQQKKMIGFIEGLAEFFPCKTCASHFKGDINRIKPRVESKKEFAVWVCEVHNETNKILGRKEFDCSFDNIMNRWYKNEECSRSNLV